jgi:arabinan endo-1,5-alpha-L-arabinosidase
VKLSENGTAVESDRITLITNDLPWEGVLVEAPWYGSPDRLRSSSGPVTSRACVVWWIRLVKQGDKYVLFYSGNMMASYAIGVASATSVSGPYTKLGNPILHSARYCILAARRL